VSLFAKFQKFFTKPKNQGRFFIIFGLIALLFGGWRIINSIRSPFLVDSDKLALQDQVQASVTDQIQSLNELRAKDTDSDGLSDYDELYNYGTSPYLEDTDGDSYLDKLEIETGNDPLCPAGQKCLLDNTGSVTSSQTATVPVADMVDPYNMSAAEIRKLLLESGLSQADLASVDDDTLRQMFRQAYLEAETQVGTQVSQGSSIVNQVQTSQNSVSSPEELRQLLISSGVPAEQVSAVSDEELLQIYQEVIGNN